jgi:protein-arginine kinase activator protein McsA
MGVRISLEEIKRRLYNLYKDKYEYDFSNFINTHSKIGVKCAIHGWSNQILKNLFKGHECNKCGNEISSNKQKSILSDTLLKFHKIHGDKYDYSKFSPSNNRTDSIIICPNHGEFNQSSWTHSKGHGCPSCSGNKTFSKDDFIKLSTSKHSKSYIYDFVNYKNMHTKVKIICPTHHEFYQTPMTHVKGSGCPKCNQSHGEKMIEIFLVKNKINFTAQKKFDDCKHINRLVFDFYLPDFNACIEFNGIQHYFPIDIFGGKDTLNITIKRDKIKEDYCKQNNIKLLIIKQNQKHINLKDVELQISKISNYLI